ncbi:hypothetical protein BAE44_0018528 [Dichanthelium oligosanthes]|uniref:Uncharacterized protein n=1 Tax=Dichanthelium oligosanthes TaxID=888268 RepID=A0A1E5V5M1_9POAL|nr:hypothetical protein BAE44_0018528 [Dichanthelium oligosanthes]
MESSRTKPEIRDEPVPAGGGFLGAMWQAANFLHTAAFLIFSACLGGLGALRQLIELEVFPRLQAAAFFLFRGRFGDPGALLQLLELEDRPLQAGAFFLTCGGCTVLYGTALNRSANPEHIFAGFFLFTLGAAISILKLAGGRPERAADHMERFLRGFF